MYMKLVAISSLLLVSACANGVPGWRPLSYSVPAETRAFPIVQSDCPHYTPPDVEDAESKFLGGGVLAALAIGAATELVDNFTTALGDAAAGGALPSSTATAAIDIDRNALPRCLVVVRGVFGSAASPDSNYPELTRALGLPPVTDLHHYIELQMRQSASETALSFFPTFTLLNQSIDGKRSGSRELAMSVNFDVVGVAEGTGSVVTVSDRNISTAYRYDWWREGDRGPVYPNSSPWFASFIGQTSDTQSARVPVTITTTIVESRPSRQYLAFLHTILEGANEEIDSEINDQLDPETQTTNQTASNTAQGQAATSLATANNSIISYCNVSGDNDVSATRNTRSATARSHQFDANSKALAAGEEIPFPDAELIIVSGDSVSTANLSGCATYVES